VTSLLGTGKSLTFFYSVLATAALWVRIQTSLEKYKIGDISKGVANTLWPTKKNIFKNLENCKNNVNFSK
jgi:hypothetical protein